MINSELILVGLLNVFAFTIVGFLLKHELHDIKNRIVRLENLFLLRKEGASNAQ